MEIPVACVSVCTSRLGPPCSNASQSGSVAVARHGEPDAARERYGSAAVAVGIGVKQHDEVAGAKLGRLGGRYPCGCLHGGVDQECRPEQPGERDKMVDVETRDAALHEVDVYENAGDDQDHH